MALKWKTAAPRAVREWQNLTSRGDAAGADQVARASGDLGLKPRFLKNLSGGGQEAAVDLTMGRAMGPEKNESGYVVKKLYKPDSLITQGRQTTALLNQKKDFTDAARALSPEAKEMVPAMYGSREIKGPGGLIRHVSEHEYVPNATHPLERADVHAQMQRVQDVVAKPMAAKGMAMKDIGRLQADGSLAGNTGNIAMQGDKAKVIDFLPQGKGRVMHVAERGPYDQVQSPTAYREMRGRSYFNDSNVNELRREVHAPQRSNFPRPTVPPAKPLNPTKAAPGPAAVAPTSLAASSVTPVAAPRPSLVRAAAQPLAHARTELAPMSSAMKATPIASPVARASSSAVTPVLNRARNFVTPVLRKLGAISDQDAEASLARLDAIEKAKPTAAQLGRYGAVGALSAPIVGHLGDMTAGVPLYGGKGPGFAGRVARGVVGRAMTGALSSGAIPLVRTHLDQEAEKGLLRGYVKDRLAEPKTAARKPSARLKKQFHRAALSRTPNKLRIAGGVDERVKQSFGANGVQAALGKLFGGQEKDSAMWGGTPARRMSDDGPVEAMKFGFATSMYSSNIGYPAVKQRSQMPPMRVPSLEGLVEKKSDIMDVVAAVFDRRLEEGRKEAGVPTTPAGLLAKSQAVGAPKVTAPAGPSIAQVAKPKGFGRPLPGAIKSF